MTLINREFQHFYRSKFLEIPTHLRSISIKDTHIRYEKIIRKLIRDRNVSFRNFRHTIDSISNEDCVEIPSKIYKPGELTKYLKEFNSLKAYLRKDFNLIESSNFSVEAEGGGHIHVSTDFLRKGNLIKIKHISDPQYKDPTIVKLFYDNLLIFQMNNPWLHWSFNSPVDNINSFINFYESLNFLKKPTIESLTPNYEWFTSSNKIVVNHRIYPCMSNPPIKYRNSFNTIEFRMFIMPRNLDENLLHIEFAHKVTNYLWDLTKKGIKLDLKFNSRSMYKKLTYEDSLKGLHKIMKTLDIEKSQYKMKVDLLKQRYSYKSYKSLLN